METRELATFIRTVDRPDVKPLVDALARRLEHLDRIGLGYLSLDRPSATLCGGESQRVKLVRHLGSSLTGMTYIFDEPSIGLHPHDVHRLNELLVQIRDKGNTVLVVEHEPDVISVADHVVDMGPGAGRAGGTVVFTGGVEALKTSDTLTGKHFARHQPLKTETRAPDGAIRIDNATLHNLDGVSVSIPRGVLTAVTGVAGSGKSSLIHGHLLQVEPEAKLIDQRLSSGNRRSNPATYTGMLDAIRKAFAQANKVPASLFSANSEGACPDCKGLGVVYTDLVHLDPVISVCERCEGQRFTDEVLQHTLSDASIADVYDMQADAALDFFTEKPIRKRLEAIRDVGLGYLTLGQPLSTLSGGERQRLKLANELDASAKTIVLDEPTTGLHMHDVNRLVALLDRLVDGGATVVVIEHDPEVIARADWVIDMGPGAGHDGGRIVFEGTPQQLMEHESSLDRPAPGACAMREGYAELDGVRLHYVEQGEGPLVVLLHGFPEFWYGWRHQIEPLADAGFRVVAPDMRGYNLCSKPRGLASYDVALLAQDVKRADRGARRAARPMSRATTGAAPSPGRPRAFTPRSSSASRSSTRPTRASSSSTSRARGSSRRSWYMGFFQLPWLPEQLGRRVLPRGFPPAERARYEEAYAQPGALTAMFNYYRAMSRDTPWGAQRRIRTVHAPTRVIWGERDRYLGPGLAEPHRADVPNLERVIRLDTSHWVQHEAPEEVAALLVEFFSLT